MPIGTAIVASAYAISVSILAAYMYPEGTKTHKNDQQDSLNHERPAEDCDQAPEEMTLLGPREGVKALRKRGQ